MFKAKGVEKKIIFGSHMFDSDRYLYFKKHEPETERKKTRRETPFLAEKFFFFLLFGKKLR